MRFAAIDPGVSGTGVAIFDEGLPIECKNFYAKGDWITKALMITTDLVHYCYMQRIEKAYVEFPEPMKGSEKAIASRDKGDTLKLACITGMIVERLTTIGVAESELVRPTQWKGQLKKEMVQQRIREWLEDHISVDLTSIKSHSWDAIGIGLWVEDEF